MNKFACMKKENIYKLENFDETQARKKLNIIHFNDAYNIESRNVEPVGGVSRFRTVIQEIIKSQSEPTVVLFSGDAFNPSTLSSVFEGRQMVETLSKLRIDCACLGNHDFDFGVDHLVELTQATNFPWLLSNVLDVKTNRPLADALKTHIIQLKDMKIGLIGIVEEEWIATLPTIDYDDIIYEPFADVAQKLATKLREEHNVDFVIALTHMRMHNDDQLARQVKNVDIILGGHDHDYNVKKIEEKFVVKSGNDFKELSLVQMCLDLNNHVYVTSIDKFIVDSSVEENEEMKEIVKKYISNMEKELDMTIGYVNTELDGRFINVRTHETNLGNLISDIVLEAVNVDCVIMNSGTIRSDTLHPMGEFKLRDLKAILPFFNTIVVIKCTGKELHEALENGVSQYPKLDGRFPQVSGIEYAFDPSKPSGQRILPTDIKVQNQVLEFNKHYTLAIKNFVANGRDGYTMLKDCPRIIDEENGPILFTIVENHFKNIQKIKKNLHQAHRPSLVSKAKRNKLLMEFLERSETVKQLKVSHDDIMNYLNDFHNHHNNPLIHQEILRIKDSEEYIGKIRELEAHALELKPQIENRITIL